MLSVRRLIVLVCIVLFVWNAVEERAMRIKLGQKDIGILLTPVQRALFFDYPHAYSVIEKWAEDHQITSLEDTQDLSSADRVFSRRLKGLAFWKGVWDWWMEGKPHVSLFEKIREGQIYRVFTPCLLHRDVMHITLNLLAFWVLAQMLERRIKPLRMVALFLLMGCIANVAQYLAGGPFFMGISGIVVGMVCFIWMRQRVAPWEGYPLHAMSFILLVVLVVLMWSAELVAMALYWVKGAPVFTVPIANTAHIVGGLVGILCGKSAVFARSLS